MSNKTIQRLSVHLINCIFKHNANSLDQYCSTATVMSADGNVSNLMLNFDIIHPVDPVVNIFMLSSLTFHRQ